jgi:CIC family chloride channel protein
MMAACILATLVHKNVLRGSIYSLSLARKGIDIDAGREMGILSNLRVREIMEPAYEAISASTPYETVLDKCLHGPSNCLYVLDDKEDLIGVVSFSDLKEFVFEEGLAGLVLAQDLTNSDVVFVTPDESLASSLNKFSFIDMEQLPVVERDNGSRKVLGIITRNQVFKAYRQEMLKRMLIRS